MSIEKSYVATTLRQLRAVIEQIEADGGRMDEPMMSDAEEGTWRPLAGVELDEDGDACVTSRL